VKQIAFASDFDNTLFFGKEAKPFHEEDLMAIKAFKEKGGLFGVCTGRSESGVLFPSKGFLDYDFRILATGSYLLDKEGKCFYQNPFSLGEATLLYENLCRYPSFSLVVNTGKSLFSSSSSFDGHPPRKGEERLKRTIRGFSLGCLKEENAAERKKKLEGSFPFLHAFQNKTFLDIVKRGNSKGEGRKRRKGHLCLDVRAGRGDSFNDIPLIEEASPSYTFLSSPKEVQAKADAVLPTLSSALLDLRKLFS